MQQKIQHIVEAPNSAVDWTAIICVIISALVAPLIIWYVTNRRKK